MGPAIEGLQRICIKLYAPEPGIDDQAFVPIFHEWIRDQAIDNLVLFDVAPTMRTCPRVPASCW